ncbi:DMT family transporter [Clostridium sp.]|uniref:DMT family transporter n=1 Tax=Clostridium sp. TaxID=1506 RepID=UPI002FC8597C
MKKKRSALPIFAGITASSIFGLSFMFSSVALKLVDTFTLLSFRFLLAFAIMSILVLTKVIKVDYKDKNLKSLFILGLMQPIVYFIFETYGIKNSSSSIAGVMIALIPITVALFSAYFLKEKPTSLQWMFIITSVIGVIFIIIMGGNSSGSMSFMGIICLLIAVLSATVFNLLSRKLSKEFSPIEITYYMMGLGALTFTIMSIIQHILKGTLSQFFAPLGNKSFVVSLMYLGILSSIIAFLFINYSLSKLEASKSAILGNFSTIVSIIAGVVFLKEDFRLFHLVGSALILIGVWGTNYIGSKIPKDTLEGAIKNQSSEL